jgi:hypothetical protein
LHRPFTERTKLSTPAYYSVGGPLLLLEIIQDAINEAFEFDGDPVENLIAAAFDNRLLR